MTRLRWAWLLGLLAISLVAAWLLWVRPEKIDMAIYAPATSLLYLESNRPLAVVDTIVGTDAWRIVDKATGTQPVAQPKGWLQSFIGWTGIGPIESVILARAQLAVVVTDLGTTEDGETLRVKPEGAVLIETHTTESRIRPPVEEALKKLAEITYGKPTARRTTIDGVEFIEWIAPEGSRQIVATIVGSLVIVGNSEQAVRSCLAVSLRRSSSLKEDPGLERMRLQLAGDRALTFGYVPSANSPHLLSVGVPLVMGRAPGDSEFQRLVTTNAAKVFGSLGWSSHPFRNGVEDRYLISLQPAVIARLKPNFARARTITEIQRRWPDHVHSVTYYRFEDPAAVWQDLKAAASSQVDVLSAVVFSSLLKSALLSYGIDEPEAFLSAVKGELLTLRLDQNGERTMIIAGVRNQESLREIVKKRLGPNSRSDRVGDAEIREDSKGEWAVSLSKDVVVLGSPLDVRRYSEGAGVNSTMMKDDDLRKITFFSPFSSSANIVTYTDDSDRITVFISAILAAKGTQSLASGPIEALIAELPYSATETTLGERGFERVTKSPLGQFSTLFPLLIPEKPGLTKSNLQSE
ncbi:MAG: hypothetical protein ACR2HX_18740 [Pyrinomonadaceae bacterium]